MEGNRVGDKKLLMAGNNKRYIEGCELCQRMKDRTEAPVGKLMVNEVLEKLYYKVTISSRKRCNLGSM